MKKDKKFTILVHDRRDGTYSYKGARTKEEIESDMTELVQEKNIPSRRLQIVPVKEEDDKKSSTSIVVWSVIGAAVIGVASFFGVKFYKKQKEQKRRKKELEHIVGDN